MLPTLARASKRRLDWQARGGSPCGHGAPSARSRSSSSCSGGGSANKALAQAWSELGVARRVHPAAISLSARDEEREQNVSVGGGTASSSGDGFFIIKYFETFIP